MKPILPLRPTRGAAACLVLAATLLRADTLEQTWVIAPLDRDYMGTGNLERGVAINPVNGNVLLLSRAGTPTVYVLDPATGADDPEGTGSPRFLKPEDVDGNPIISGGTFSLNLVGAADDGAVYACNLATSLGTVRIYRWADDQTDTPISLAYEGDPLSEIASPGSGQDIRFGDNFAVRGAGPNTQLVQTARNGKYIILYTTEDGATFKSQAFVSPAAALGKIGLGVTFGEGTTIWAKLNGYELHRIELNPATGQASMIGTVPTTVVAGGVTGISVDPVAKRLAAVSYTAHSLTVFDISDPTALIQIGDPLAFPTANANGNGTAAAGIKGDQVVGLDTNNGLLAARVKKSQTADPPTITAQPAAANVYEGGTATLAVVVQGTPPFTYEWYKDGNRVPNAASPQLALSPAKAADAGAYRAIVRNAAGFAESAEAMVTVRVPLNTPVLSPLWSLPPGSRDYINTDNTQRGLAYNPVTGRVLLVTRTGGDKVVVLDGQTGQELHQLNLDNQVVFGGTFAVNMVGVAEDGAVYVANLTTDGTASALKIYRWENDSADATPMEIYAGDPGEGTADRWGDSLAVRGGGDTTQLLLASRFGTAVAVFTPDIGAASFSPRRLDVTDAAAGNFGLAVAFGAGNTFWGTANGSTLRRVGFDLEAGTASTLHEYVGADFPTAVTVMAVDPVNLWLAGVALENPDNVQLYDIANLEAAPVLLDQELILTDNPNINGTGAVAFGTGRLYVLDSNNGVLAYTLREQVPQPTLTQATLRNGNLEFVLQGVTGTTYTLQGTTDFKTWNDLFDRTLDAPTATLTLPTVTPAMQFIRAKVK